MGKKINTTVATEKLLKKVAPSLSEQHNEIQKDDINKLSKEERIQMSQDMTTRICVILDDEDNEVISNVIKTKEHGTDKSSVIRYAVKKYWADYYDDINAAEESEKKYQQLKKLNIQSRRKRGE